MLIRIMTDARIRASIVGGSGYTGGELLRILLDHPNVDPVQLTSERLAGKRVTRVHPNLRGHTTLSFSAVSDLKPCDVLFLALPHGAAMNRFDEFSPLAKVIIDLSADFRLRNPSDYAEWYGHDHSRPELLSKFVYGIPELHREELKGADYISSAGCQATASILSLWPLFRTGVVDMDAPVVVEAKSGSSASGASAGDSSHHPERSGVIRPFMPTGHRHSAELTQELGSIHVNFSVTSVEAVRGVLATCHVFTKERLDERAVWNLFREAYAGQPFIRIVKEAQGIHRYPEPKILAGSNYCDVGFECDAHSNRIVTMGAIDNLTKGAAGQAVQAMNIRCGFEETAGLGFPGLHPL